MSDYERHKELNDHWIKNIIIYSQFYISINQSIMNSHVNYETH